MPTTAKLFFGASELGGGVSFNSATGGTITTTSVGGIYYQIHTFTSNGTFSVSSALMRFEMLLLGGGGGGGYASTGNGAGGGGAGGLLWKPYVTLSETDYAVTVGNGGSVYSNGGNTVFGSLYTALGGGRGGSQNADTNAASGGSGGGAAAAGQSSGNGGSATQPSSQWGGYGNSGGSVGRNAGSAYGGGAFCGSSGMRFEISGSSIIYGNGGPNSASGTSQSAPVANRGHGGTGGGPGGSGVVIIRYQIAAP